MLETDKRAPIVTKDQLIKPSGEIYTNICAGIGIDTEVPLRIGAYSLPVLQLGEKIYGANTEFYIASQFAQQLNKVDSSLAVRNEQAIQTFYDLLQQKLQLTKTPSWLPEDDPFDPNRTALLAEWADVLKKHGSERIIRFAENRNGDDSLSYIAAHTLYMWDCVDIDPALFITQRPVAPKSLLMVGGPAEKIFYEARQVILQNVPISNGRHTEQQFTEIGRRPPYYAIDGEDTFKFGRLGEQRSVDLDQILAIQDPDVLRDTLYLIISLTEGMTFSDLKRIKKGQINDIERQDLMAACKSLEEIVRQIES